MRARRDRARAEHRPEDAAAARRLAPGGPAGSSLRPRARARTWEVEGDRGAAQATPPAHSASWQTPADLATQMAPAATAQTGENPTAARGKMQAPKRARSRALVRPLARAPAQPPLAARQ